MNILLLSLGGGGGNILRSTKELFGRDLAVTQKGNGKFADRLRRAVTTRFLDTNEFSLASVPPEERVIIGEKTTGRLGARHDPAVAAQALEESRTEVETLLAKYSVVIVIGTGGKGTGAGTMVEVVQMARAQRKLVIPIFVRPSFERHEVDKRRYDHALSVVDRFDSAKIRLIEILNDHGYTDADPQPQSVVWERMNRPIARGLRGLMYVLSDLSQVDPSDLSTLFAGSGRLRMGFAEIDPPDGRDPSQEQVAEAVRACWQNSYYSFSKPVGTSLVCIQGEWSNVADAAIKGGLAAMATSAGQGFYTPLHARAVLAPRPWGVTALFSEATGPHAPLDVDWTSERKPDRFAPVPVSRREPRRVEVEQVQAVERSPTVPEVVPPKEQQSPEAEAGPSFATFRDLARAVNRSDRAALALAHDSAPTSGISVNGDEIRKLLGTMWFRDVIAQLSEPWRQRLLDVLIGSTVVADHVLKVEHHDTRLSELTYAQLAELVTRVSVPEVARADIDLLINVGRHWGSDAIGRFQFAPVRRERSRFVGLLQGLGR